MGSQPAGHSAWCFFKNPPWPEREEEKQKLMKKFPELEKFSQRPKIGAGFLLELAGLKGKKMNNAMISEKHAGFIINGGQAKAENILELADLAKEKIKKRYGINLEYEVQLIGF
jgi:UDP-N-acetylmuramate dehydrogenase